LTPFHPLNLRRGWLNRLSGPLLKTYGSLPLSGAEAMVAQADLLVFDSDHGLFLFDRFKKLNPRARCVYRVSDDLPTMRQHPILLATELRLQNEFDLVSVPSEFMRERLAASGKVELHRHGLRRELFERPCSNPFANAGPNVLFVGRKYLDADFLARATTLFPAWSFHVFGPTDHLPSAPNLSIYGERSFEELIPYLRHADIGLQTLIYWPGAECFTDSLKMQQYTFCRLPIVAPAFLRTLQPHVFYYEAGDDESIRRALKAAIAFDRGAIPVGDVGTWDEMIVKLAG
jgi:2-beta-glucuronyltransferase